jgi:hypothetical protein
LLYRRFRNQRRAGYWQPMFLIFSRRRWTSSTADVSRLRSAKITTATACSTTTGGNDPNDDWDTGVDGLSIATRSRWRERGCDGGARPPLSRDTDGDGMCDDMEVRFGSYPNQRDTDGDGLTDGHEVWHYNCGSGRRKVLTSSRASSPSRATSRPRASSPRTSTLIR